MDRRHREPSGNSDDQQRHEDQQHHDDQQRHEDQNHQQRNAATPQATVVARRAYVEEDQERNRAFGSVGMAPSRTPTPSYEYPSPTLQPPDHGPYRLVAPRPTPGQPFFYGPDLPQPWQQMGAFHFPSRQTTQAPPSFLQATPTPVEYEHDQPNAQPPPVAPKGRTTAGVARQKDPRDLGEFRCGICGVKLTRMGSVYEPHFLSCLRKNGGTRYSRWDDHPSCWLDGGQAKSIPRGYDKVMQSMGMVPYDWEANPEGRVTNVTHDRGPGGKVGLTRRKKRDDNEPRGQALAAAVGPQAVSTATHLRGQALASAGGQQAVTLATHPPHTAPRPQRSLAPTGRVVNWLASHNSRSTTMRFGGPSSGGEAIDQAGVVGDGGAVDGVGSLDYEGDTAMTDDVSSADDGSSTVVGVGETSGREEGAHARQQHREIAALLDDTESSLSSAESEPTRKFGGSWCGE